MDRWSSSHHDDKLRASFLVWQWPKWMAGFMGVVAKDT
jgi:hypothetical protein